MTEPTVAEMPEALRLADKLDSLCVAEFAWPTLRAASSELRRLHALGAAAPAVAPADLITIRKPTTPAEVAWLAKLAHLLVSDVNKTLDEALKWEPHFPVLPWVGRTPRIEHTQRHGWCVFLDSEDENGNPIAPIAIIAKGLIDRESAEASVKNWSREIAS